MALIWSLLIVDPLIVLSTIACGLVSVIASLFDSTGHTAIRVARVWSRSLLLFARVRVKMEGLQKIDPGTSYVFCSNHLSYMDTPVVLSSIPAEFRFLAKEGLFQIPFLGTHLKQAGHIPVPREDPRRAVRAMTRAGRIMREHGVSVLIFPEGGRSRDGVLQTFKEGAAYIAIKAQAPLVPVALVGTRKILPFGSAVFHPGRVRLRVGDPIPTEGLTLRDRGALTEAAHQQIADMLGTEAEVNPRT
jgi:1-acyl-sn-glycerol-3-phosphate acyltransferase